METFTVFIPVELIKGILFVTGMILCMYVLLHKICYHEGIVDVLKTWLSWTVIIATVIVILLWFHVI